MSEKTTKSKTEFLEQIRYDAWLEHYQEAMDMAEEQAKGADNDFLEQGVLQ